LVTQEIRREVSLTSLQKRALVKILVIATEDAFNKVKIDTRHGGANL
jgi:hypothetical protein